MLYFDLEWNLQRTDLTKQEMSDMINDHYAKIKREIVETTDKELKGKLCRRLSRMAALIGYFNIEH